MLRAANGVKPTQVGFDRRIDGGVILLDDLFKVMMVLWRRVDGRMERLRQRQQIVEDLLQHMCETSIWFISSCRRAMLPFSHTRGDLAPRKAAQHGASEIPGNNSASGSRDLLEESRKRNGCV